MNRYHMGNCRNYVGQAVAVRTPNGVQQGIVEKVTKKGMYLKPFGGQYASGQNVQDFVTAEQEEQRVLDAVKVRGYRGPYGGVGPYGGGYGYNPYAPWFVSFLTILALWPLLFW